MWLQKYLLLILLQAMGSFAFSGISGRIKLTAVFKKRNENQEPKEQTTLNQGTESPPLKGATHLPSDVEESQSSYGLDNPGTLNGASSIGREDMEQPAPIATGTNSELEGTLDGGGYHPVVERNPPNIDKIAAPTLGQSGKAANQQQTQVIQGTSAIGENSSEDTFFSAEDQTPASFEDIGGSQEHGEEGSTDKEGPLITEGSTVPHYDPWPPLYGVHGSRGSSEAPVIGIIIVNGGPSTVEGVVGGGTSYTDTQSVQPFNQWDGGGTDSSGREVPNNQAISPKGGVLDGSLASGSNKNSGTSYPSYSSPLQSSIYPDETQPHYSEISTEGTQSFGATGEEKPTYQQPLVGKGNTDQDRLSGETLDPRKISSTESNHPYNIISSEVLGASNEGRKPSEVSTPDVDATSDKGNTRIKIGRRKKGISKSRKGTQSESVQPAEGLVKKSNDKNVPNKGGKESEGLNDMPNEGGEEKGQHKEADEGEVIMHLESSRDTEYYGKIMLGTAEDGQEQWFTVVIDTGSADLWVPGRGSCVPDILQDCNEFRGFDVSRSSTFKPLEKPFILTYGDGSRVKGKLATDIMKLGSGKTQIVVPEILFGLGETTENFHSKADGILGLGFNYGSGFPGKPTSPFQEMINQAKILPQFGIFLNRKTDGEEIGELVLGGHDEDLIEEEFTFVNVRTSYFAYRYWLFKLDGILVGDQPVDYDTNIRALADSGATLIVVPTTVLNKINTAVWGSDSANWKKFFVCNTVNIEQLPNITFKIKDKPFVLTPEEYILKIPEELSSEEAKYFSNEEQRCIFGIREDYVPDQIVLGQVFMRVYYTKFDWDKKQIGFARAKHGTA